MVDVDDSCTVGYLFSVCGRYESNKFIGVVFRVSRFALFELCVVQS